MLSFQTGFVSKSFSPICVVRNDRSSRNMLPISNVTLCHSYDMRPVFVRQRRYLKTSPCFAYSRKSNSGSSPGPDPEAGLKSKSKAETGNQNQKSVFSHNKDENHDKSFPKTIPKKPRRGRRNETVAVEDFIRDSLEQTFESIRRQNPEVFENKENVMKDRLENEFDRDSSSDEDKDEDGEVGKRGKKMVVEEEDPDWPLDADVGWGIRASEYFEQHAIKNVVGEDGSEIDWEGEIDDSWVKEINCLEWESFAFHPSPLIVLVFERYKRATHNWKTLKELEKAIQVYWNSKDRLPPRGSYMLQGR
ncbi:thioredoxin-like fold domain-containing protein MRL7, chloroplastic isoform X2 [Hibiscus syriacus]|uniref:thioredoxin-like fold domain-containing protein MRL7, chloroplastic isoform X2 n=1 Tax=Hibiscus syriacus TaxID=106335 RepID=UPI00192067CC|nr:thioredoxin-like fold domain-containing protein MRL7, chloroplastic isoform X2 [Hibiscus syriacus]